MWTKFENGIPDNYRIVMVRRRSYISRFRIRIGDYLVEANDKGTEMSIRYYTHGWEWTYVDCDYLLNLEYVD